MGSNIIEKAAKAICRQQYLNVYQIKDYNEVNIDIEKRIDEAFERNKTAYISFAKAAIEAIRDVDDKLMFVLENDGYNAMIDAVLGVEE